MLITHNKYYLRESSIIIVTNFSQLPIDPSYYNHVAMLLHSLILIEMTSTYIIKVKGMRFAY